MGPDEYSDWLKANGQEQTPNGPIVESLQKYGAYFAPQNGLSVQLLDGLNVRNSLSPQFSLEGPLDLKPRFS